MGAYLSKPKTEISSSVSSNDSLSCGASAMQGWRVSMEDAHTCILDFDKNTSLFAVFDGHGGSEVALYAEKHLAEVLKTTEGYKSGNAKQGLTEAFLKIDEDIMTEEGLKELKEIAGENGDESGDENEADLLAQDAAIPLKELLAKLKGDIYKLEKDETKDEESDENEEDKMEEKTKPAENGDVNDKDTKFEVVEETEEDEMNGNKSSKAKERQENGETQKVDNDKDENWEDKHEAEKGDDDDDKDDAEQHDEEDGSEDEEEDEDEEEEDDDDKDNEDDDDDDDENDGMVSTTDEVGYDSGTTAIVAMVKDDQLTVANAGDSRCVLCRNGIALEMSIDHKPEDAKELNRIQNAGGKVTGEGRVNGGLNLSRAIGDHSYKGRTELAAEEQQITAMPDVRQTRLTEDDEFMVIACDGIWNVMNSQEVVDFVKDELKKQRSESEVNLTLICEKLFKACLAPDTSGDGSGCDNMTCLIVTFDKLRNKKAGKRKSPEQTEITNPDKKCRTDKE